MLTPVISECQWSRFGVFLASFEHIQPRNNKFMSTQKKEMK